MLCLSSLSSPHQQPFCHSRAGLRARHGILWVHQLQVQRKASSLRYWTLQDGDSSYKPLVREPIWRKLNHSLRLSARILKACTNTRQASATSHQGLNHSFKIKTSLIALRVGSWMWSLSQTPDLQITPLTPDTRHIRRSSQAEST